MSDHHLPDDPARWPADPFALLGVNRGASPLELKRAYTRLIRAFKPEQFPDEFRRIREAYETALRYTDLFTPGSGEPPGPDAVRFTPAEPIPAPVRDPQDDLDAVWEQAVSGDEEPAYRRLLDWQQRHPAHTGGLLRLYWLLTINPALDPKREPADWLAVGLRANGLTGPLAALYARELAERPAEALTDRCAALLATPAGHGPLADLASRRWEAALRLGGWRVVRDDLAEMRGRFVPDGQTAWVRLLFAAAHGLAWLDDAEAQETAQECRRELDSAGQLIHDLAGEFDRLDFLSAVASGWRGLRGDKDIPDELLDLIRLSWTRPAWELRPRVEALVRRIAGAPLAWLGHLDLVELRASAVLAQFGTVLEQYAVRSESVPRDLHDPEALHRLAAEFFDERSNTHYRSYRPELLEFCLHEWVAPEWLARVISDPEGQALASDWSLRYVCRACRLYGA
jgi:hypothetical protein